jgi:aconitate hydratase
VTLLCRIDTLDELEYYRHGGILQYVMRQIMNDGNPSRKAA